ncbi:hypothetical protein [Corynebacterium variabile]|uniref:hypothetical protein n=1 Tax=Corynebacterium variabile TaxID=1727 RepID=UPI003F91A3E7
MDDLESMFELETFEAGGRELFEGMQDDLDPTDVRSLVIELCRVKDRLDRLHRMSSRDDREWGRVLPSDMEGEFTLQIGGVLRELRQTEVVYKQLMAEVARRRSEYDDDGSDESGGLDGL